MLHSNVVNEMFYTISKSRIFMGGSSIIPSHGRFYGSQGFPLLFHLRKEKDEKKEKEKEKDDAKDGEKKENLDLLKMILLFFHGKSTTWGIYRPWRIHGAAIYGNMDPINIPPLC